ncbi:MAG: glutamate-cysteine ligase family protein [bacterium]|nr:glutamate-cysteine ligase family protein [bacterium]
MTESVRPYRPFEALGIEIEFMIADRSTLNVRPVGDELIRSFSGAWSNEFERGEASWCNELVMHVLELRTTTAAATPAAVLPLFRGEVEAVSGKLASLGARLMPGGAHPWMDPKKETKLWPHENREIYEQYDEIFDCRRHGWSNLQSLHINLPFQTDEEFGRLHAACRALLPIIPALAAATPILELRHEGFLDQRMEVYRSNSAKIPSMTGEVIPEALFSEEDYRKEVFAPLFAELAPFDPDNILSGEWANARGAIARFDRGSIEIRTIDAQESVMADLAVVAAVWQAVKALTIGPIADFIKQSKWEIAPLKTIHNETVRHGGDAVISSPEYISLFGLKDKRLSAMELWMGLLEGLKGDFAVEEEFMKPLRFITCKGCLAARILKVSGRSPKKGLMEEILSEMCRCLDEDRLFEG